LDLSPKMLELDRQIARERKLDIRVIEGAMDDLSMLEPGSFDVVMHPVSTCYVPEVGTVYRQVARVLTTGGVYVSQHKQPISLQCEARSAGAGYWVREPYYRSGPLPPGEDGWWHREAGTVEFLHRWEQLLGCLCKNGFVIEDVAEPRHGDPRAEAGSFGHRSCFIPPYVKIKARRTATELVNTPAMLWTPH
jgi:SAM-dependent methyltransferase